jgi:hypothetical protein
MSAGSNRVRWRRVPLKKRQRIIALAHFNAARAYIEAGYDYRKAEPKIMRVYMRMWRKLNWRAESIGDFMRTIYGAIRVIAVRTDYRHRHTVAA